MVLQVKGGLISRSGLIARSLEMGLHTEKLACKIFQRVFPHQFVNYVTHIPKSMVATRTYENQNFQFHRLTS